MESKTFKLEVDADVSLGYTGIDICVYIGDHCEPCVEATYDWETLIEKHFESFMMYDTIRDIDLPDAEAAVNKMERMVKYARGIIDDFKQNNG